MSRICIAAAKRTPQGRFLGALARYSSVELAKIAGKSLFKQIEPKDIDQVIVGNVLSAGAGMNIARQIGIGLEVPADRIAFSVNMMCASGMQAVVLAAQSIITGQAKIVLCGGTESMSNAPYLLSRARQGYKLGDGTLIDSLLRDGLVDSFSDTHMGLLTEQLAINYKIGRAQQDEFALKSQQNYAKAAKNGKFADELVATEKLDHDEHPRPDTTLNELTSLKSVFKKDGTVTAANASGINDGAAMLVVCEQTVAKEKGWEQLAVINAWSSMGCEPAMMGLGPVCATKKLCQQHNLKLKDFDTVEINEAFAAQTLACIKDLDIDPARVNPEGGAIAMGHPIGASGARLIVHLAHKIHSGQAANALATLCVGGGMGIAVAMEAP